MKSLSLTVATFAAALALPLSAAAALLEIDTDNVWATSCFDCDVDEYERGYDLFTLGQIFRLDTDTSQIAPVAPGSGGWQSGYTHARLYSDRDIGIAVDYVDIPGDRFAAAPRKLAGPFWVGLARGPLVNSFSDRFPYDSLSWGEIFDKGVDMIADLETAPAGTVLRYEALWQSWDRSDPNFVSPTIWDLPGPRSFVEITVLENDAATTLPATAPVPLPPSAALAGAAMIGLIMAGRRRTGRH